MIGDGGDAAATCTRNASCNRGVHDHGNARTSYPPSLIADTISGRLGMEGNVLRASSFTLPLRPFSSITEYDALLDQPALSIFGRSADDGKVTIPGGDGTDRKEGTPSYLPPFCFMPPQDIPVLPRLPLLGAAFRLGGRYRRDPRFSWRRPASSAGIIMRHEGERQRGERFKVLLSSARASKAAPFFLFVHCSPPSFVEIGR